MGRERAFRGPQFGSRITGLEAKGTNQMGGICCLNGKFVPAKHLTALWLVNTLEVSKKTFGFLSLRLDSLSQTGALGWSSRGLCPVSPLLRAGSPDILGAQPVGLSARLRRRLPELCGPRHCHPPDCGPRHRHPPDRQRVRWPPPWILWARSFQKQHRSLRKSPVQEERLLCTTVSTAYCVPGREDQEK